MKSFYLVFCASIILFSCHNNEENKLTQNYTNTQQKYSISFPDYWQMDSMQYIISEQIKSNEDDFKENIKIGIEKTPIPISVAQYANVSNTMFKLLDSTFKNVKMETTTINKIPACKTLFTSNKNGKSIEGVIYTLVKDTVAYTLQCNATENSYPFHQKIFENIFNTFKIIE